MPSVRMGVLGAQPTKCGDGTGWNSSGRTRGTRFVGCGYWTWPSYGHFRDHNHVFSVMTGTSVDTRVNVRTEDSEPEIVIGEHFTGNFFPVLGLKPAIRRLIGPQDDPTAAAGAVAVVSWPYWNTRFHLDPAILGKRIVVQDRPVTIIGVIPRAFFGLRAGSRTDIWLPRRPNASMGLYLSGTARIRWYGDYRWKWSRRAPGSRRCATATASR